MKRKLVKQGAATMMVSLPAKWIKENKLEKGNDVELEQVDNNLIVSPGEVKIKSETEIKLINVTESSIRTLITNTYRSGYDRIKVEFQNDSQFRILNNVIKTRLLGFEVTKKEENQCVVESVTEPSEEKFETILKKMLFSITELFEITKKRIENPKEDYDYEDTEERIQKYDNFCRRMISKRRVTGTRAEFLWTFLTLVIHGQREIYHMNKFLGKIKLSPKTMELLDDAEYMFNHIKKAYLEKDIHILAHVHEKEKELLYKKGFSMLRNKKGRENWIIYHIMLAIREFYQSNSPLSGLIV